MLNNLFSIIFLLWWILKFIYLFFVPCIVHVHCTVTVLHTYALAITTCWPPISFHHPRWIELQKGLQCEPSLKWNTTSRPPLCVWLFYSDSLLVECIYWMWPRDTLTKGAKHIFSLTVGLSFVSSSLCFYMYAIHNRSNLIRVLTTIHFFCHDKVTTTHR